MPKKRQRNTVPPPDPTVMALANLGRRVEMLEKGVVKEAASKVADVFTPLNTLDTKGIPAASPPTSIDTATLRILEAVMKLGRIEEIAFEFANSVDGSVPQATEAPLAGSSDRPHLHSAISLLERKVDAIFDQIGRIHPNPRT